MVTIAREYDEGKTAVRAWRMNRLAMHKDRMLALQCNIKLCAVRRGGAIGQSKPAAN